MLQRNLFVLFLDDYLAHAHDNELPMHDQVNTYNSRANG